jgi:hypothetical protein
MLLCQRYAVHILYKEMIVAKGEMRFWSEHGLADRSRITKCFL